MLPLGRHRFRGLFLSARYHGRRLFDELPDACAQTPGMWCESHPEGGRETPLLTTRFHYWKLVVNKGNGMRQRKAQQLTDVVLTVFRLNGALIGWGDDFAAPEGLTSARWQMLGALALAGRPLTAPHIAASMGVTRQGAQKQLNLLARDGLIEARANPQHKRSPLYALTQHGHDIYAAVDRRWSGYAVQVATEFSAADLATTAKVLAALAKTHAKPGHSDET